jgi:DNA-directed RNA polymerase specialized sigma24 family protein
LGTAVALTFFLLETLQEKGRLEDCLGELDEQQAAAIRSAFIDGFSYEELATCAVVPLGTMNFEVIFRGSSTG